MSNVATGLNADQIQYLRDVLGIEGLVVPPFEEAGTSVARGPLDPIEAPAQYAPNSDSALTDETFNSLFKETPQPEWRSSGDQNAAKLIVLIASDDSRFPLEGEAGELTRKMIQAMKYPSSYTYILEWTHARSGNAPEGLRELLFTEPKPLLIFGANTGRSLASEVPAFGRWTTWEGHRLVLTEHPQDLLIEPDKKRVAWAHLQTFMKGLS